MPDFGPPPAPHELQFQHAELISEVMPASGPVCVVCKRPVGATYFHAQGQTVCPDCAQRIESGQQAPPAISLARAALYGGGAALAGCALYALVAIVTNAEIGLIAILIGWMVGKAIRHASHGLGGRPQQILAIVLTYFAISTSYIPVMIYQMFVHPSPAVQKQIAAKKAARPSGQVTSDPVTAQPAATAVGKLLLALLLLAAVAPFLQLTGGIGGLISLFILFLGLQRAWVLTARSEILVMGPYPVDTPQ